MALRTCLACLLAVGSAGVRSEPEGDASNITDLTPNFGSKVLENCTTAPIELGKGQYGTVWRATCPKGDSSKELVQSAIKIMDSVIAYIGEQLSVNEKRRSFGDGDEEVSPDALTEFMREVETQQTAAKLGLAPKVWSYEIFQPRAEAQALYEGLKLDMEWISWYGRISMEIAPGRPLKDVMRKLGNESNAAWATLNLVAGAIEKIHGSSLYHGDLSFDNVFIDGDKVTLIDFGKARVSENPQPEEVFAKHCKVFFGLMNAAYTVTAGKKSQLCDDLAAGQTVDPP